LGKYSYTQSDFVSQEEWRAVKKYQPVEFRLFRTGTGFKGVEARRAGPVLAKAKL
jgi:hypothetical protein